jgi:hypothetical protein
MSDGVFKIMLSVFVSDVDPDPDAQLRSVSRCAIRIHEAINDHQN